MNRRDFIGTTTRVFFGAAAASAATRAPRADAANDKIRVGCIGLGGRSRSHIYGLTDMDDVEVTWVCEVNGERIGSMPDQINDRQGRAPRVCTDMREIFDDPDVDAVVIAAPDHWHALATVWACQAGKDVYVEKPACNNIWEGQKMIEAARKYKRVVQVGSQNRSGDYTQSARDYIQGGGLGSVHMVKVFNMEDGKPWKLAADQDAPGNFDWNLYRGPAPMRPYNPNIPKDGGWKRFWETGGGDTTDDSVHQLDVARMLIGDPTCPNSVAAQGGMIAFPDDDGEVPDTLSASFQYDRVLMTLDLTQWAGTMHKVRPEARQSDAFPEWPFCSSRIEVYGTEARMFFGRQGGGWQVLLPGGEVKDQFPGYEPSQPHRRNFIDCIRSRETPNADIEIGYHSCLLAHLANTAVRVGGTQLKFDLDAMQYKDNAAAQALLKPAYREGFTIPDTV